jgi:hypothetical protein
MVTIGVNAHKRSHTLAAVDGVGRRLSEKTIKATPDGHLEAVEWAGQWPERVFALMAAGRSVPQPRAAHAPARDSPGPARPMSGCWITWEAGITTRLNDHDLADALDQAIYRLWQNTDITGGHHEHDPARDLVTFTVQVRYVIAPLLATLLAERALYDALRRIGFGVPRGWTTARPHTSIRLTRWPF